MKNILIAFFFSIIAYSQETTYMYYVHVSNFNSAHKFAQSGNGVVYDGKDNEAISFFDKYQIVEFKQAFPDAIDTAVSNIEYIETTNSKFIEDLIKEYPSIYLSAEDLTNIQITFLDTYPNDYGTTSPNPNFGFAHANTEFDYIHAPLAWDITKGDSKVKIGISDTPIYYTDPDLVGKITPVSGYTQSLQPNSHGTGVAAIAAARGDNSYASVGVCMDCDIVEAYIDIGTKEYELDSNLYQMALAGARVINMSWTNSGYVNMDTSSPYYYNPNDTFPISTQQSLINDLVNNFRVTLVAAAGNTASFGTPTSNVNGVPYGVRCVYPASYDNVISVSSVHHKNKYTLPLSSSSPSYCCTSSLYECHYELEDSVSYGESAADPNNPVAVIAGGFYQSPTNQTGFLYGHTLNEKVDILAPGYDTYWHAYAILDPTHLTESGTSLSAPMVSGTIGLMISINDCLTPNEIETILKVSSKDIENMPMNINFRGFVGAGALNTGDSVVFTNEMQSAIGNAVIDNHIFNRYNFNLDKINNKLTMHNVVFQDNNISDFTARNSIELLADTDFIPNSDGYVDLKINGDMDITCSPVVYSKGTNESKKGSSEILSSLYPNPNNGDFTITLSKQIKGDVNVAIYDLYGKLVYKGVENKSVFNLSLPNLSSGLYVVKIKGLGYNETLKLIKN